MAFSVAGYLLIMHGSARLSRVMSREFRNNDPFDKENEGFPQEEGYIETEYSINLPAVYRYRNEERQSWINIINPRRGILIMGSPGCGKSYFIIENIIRQLMAKGFAMFIYDLKYDQLTRLAFTHFLKNVAKYPNLQFHTINFTDLRKTHRCNVIDPATMYYTSDAIGTSRSLMLSMNKIWALKGGDFFVESAINFMAAIIWYLRRYQNGKYCTLPHAIELAQTSHDKLFTLLNTQPEIEALVNSFINAYREGVMETVVSQVSSAQIAISRLASPEIYYVLTGNDFTLDINSAVAPKIFCLGGDPTKQEALAPVISLYIDRLNSLINKEGRHPCAIICDEFASLRAASVLDTMSQARSSNVVTVISVQDISQLRSRYTHDEADQVVNMVGNIICGQVGGATAKSVSERFPGTMQSKTTITSKTMETTISKSRQLTPVVLPSTIATLSSGEFLGIVADDPKTPIELKAFHARIINDHEALERERDRMMLVPFVSDLSQDSVLKQFQKVKQEVQDLVNSELTRIMNDSSLAGYIVKRGDKKK